MLRDKEISLQKKVNLLQAQAEENPHNKNITHELQVEKSRLKKIMTYRTKGAILRSKVRWHEDGERNTKYFYALEKRNYTNKAITRLKIAENAYTEDQFNIPDKEKCFYESLYKSKNIDAEKLKKSPFFNAENITPLNEDERLSCEGQITVNRRSCLTDLAGNSIVWDTKEPTHCSKRVGDVIPGVVVWPCSGRGPSFTSLINCKLRNKQYG